jgi:hypothetical protein
MGDGRAAQREKFPQLRSLDQIERHNRFSGVPDSTGKKTPTRIRSSFSVRHGRLPRTAVTQVTENAGSLPPAGRRTNGSHARCAGSEVAEKDRIYFIMENSLANEMTDQANLESIRGASAAGFPPQSSCIPHGDSGHPKPQPENAESLQIPTERS